MTATPLPREFQVNEAESRLDLYLAGVEVGITRSRLRRLIAEGQVTVNGLAVNPAHKVRSGDLVQLSVPPPRPAGIVAQDIPVAVVYQDEQLVVIDKPAGLAVHPGPGHPDLTLVNALLAMCPDIQGVGGELRPGIVHRLDKDTSGLMVAAKTDLAHPRHRTRMAVVAGGRESRTRYRVLESFKGSCLLELYLETGRTHQIRVHMAHVGHSLIGDSVYGKRHPVLSRHFLHAHHLSFRHPVSHRVLDLRSELPSELTQILEALRHG